MTDAGNTSQTAEKKDSPFAFGRNWKNFLASLDENRIEAAETSVQSALAIDSLSGQRFLDAGSGSGLFSLAAYRLGADVTSFDADPDSVACTQELKTRYGNATNSWSVMHGSLMDVAFLKTLDSFDVVYCWGVAHHTGNMWAAVENLTKLVSKDGRLVLAIYNDQLYVSRAWRGIKQIYQRLPSGIRPLFAATIGMLTFAKRLMVTVLACLLRLLTLRNPFVPVMNWARETQARGMHGWYDLVDWVGGWPFEVARPEDIFRFLRDRGFRLDDLTTCAGHGCNEFVFTRVRGSENSPERHTADER